MARKLAPFAFLALAPLLALWRAIFGGLAIGPHDQVASFAPWNRQGPMGAWDILPIDGVIQFHVWRDLVFAAWRGGEIPFWNPYSLGGTPLLANAQSGALYPPHILFAFSGVPTAAAVAILAWLHLALAGIGIYMLCRRLGSGEAGALMGGVSFALSPFLLGWTPLASVIATVAWIPWMLWAISRIAKDDSPLRPAAWLGLFFGLAVTAGHLQFVAYAGMAGLLFGLALILSEKGRATRLLPLMAGLALGGCWGAPALLPIMKYGEFSHRRGAPTEEGYTAYSNSALKPWELGALVNPVALGNPRLRILDEGPEAPPFSSYWPAYVKLGANWAEGAISPGPLAILGLCFLPFVWRRLRETGAESGALSLGILALSGLLLALGTPLNRLLYFGVPGWSSTGSPGRASVLFVLAACALAGLVVDRLSRKELPNRSFRFGLLTFVVIGFASFGLSATKQAPIPGFGEIMNAASAAAAAIALLVTFLLLTFAAQAPIVSRLPFAEKYQIGIWPAAVVVCAQFWGASWIVPVGKAIEPVAIEGVGPHDRVAVVNRDWSLFGPVKSVQYPPNTLALARIREIGGYDSLLHRDTAALLRELNSGEDPAPPANGNMMLIKPKSSPSELAQAGVTRIVGELQSAEVAKSFPMIGRVSRSNGTAEIVSETFNTVTVKTSAPEAGVVILRDRAMDGWTANGKPVPQSRWLEAEAPSGESTITFRYEAPGFQTGLMLFGMGFLVSVGLAGMGRSKVKTLHLAEDRLDGVVEGNRPDDTAMLVGDESKPGGASA